MRQNRKVARPARECYQSANKPNSKRKQRGVWVESSEENSANVLRGPQAKTDYHKNPVTPRNPSASVSIPTTWLLGAKTLGQVWEEHKGAGGIQSPATGGPQQFHPCGQRSGIYILMAAQTQRSFFLFI